MGLAFPVALLAAIAVGTPESMTGFGRFQPFTIGTPAQAQTSTRIAGQPNWAIVEQGILAEHNRVRQNPQSYLPILEAYLARMNAEGNIPGGCGPNCTLQTREGRPAVEEAINFLRNQPAVGPLTLSTGAAHAAKAHAQDQRDGTIGHSGSDGSSPSERLSRFGVENLGSGENIAYGPNTAEDVMLGLIIDDGVADRGHRTSIFSPDWTMAGVGCGPHASIRTVCVIDYIKTAQTTASNSRLSVVNGGTVDLLSLKIANSDILGGPLAPGQSREITLNNHQACEVTLRIQLGGNYRPLNWDNLYICDIAMTIDRQNNFTVRY